MKSLYKAWSVDTHIVHSKNVAQAFSIKVFQPMRLRDESERFPVFYSTDAHLFFDGLANIAHILQLMGEVRRFVLVGIGYQNEEASELLRWRDFVTHETRTRYEAMLTQILTSDLAAGVPSLDEITRTTDAANYLAFLHEELMPFIAARYCVLSEDRNYFGYSAGATFGIFSLFTRPETFKRYILGSPASSFGGANHAVGMALPFVASNRTMSAQVFMSVGELEEFRKGHEQFDFVTGYYGLLKFINDSSIPGLSLTSRVFSGETHATSWTLAFTHGLKALLGMSEPAPWLGYQASPSVKRAM